MSQLLNLKPSDGHRSNPCVRNCCLDEQDICLGCFRSLDEILAWRKLTEEQRRAVMLEAKKRREARLTDNK
ncbi:DUF1289 domain-containing protein [Alkalimarinus coralli]|uniref:DUF1289 domain-containing protein n=1 Tax=Alkalimarinus coralli TaxID=2935863 RepID=UPI00202B1252|nr:DUF1289 domain-containing protein [Alkalimarinus coralli]